MVVEVGPSQWDALIPTEGYTGSWRQLIEYESWEESWGYHSPIGVAMGLGSWSLHRRPPAL